jgi:aldehyde dehydrogenase
MRYAHPGQPGALVSFKSAYGNFIDGKFVEPLSGEFFMNTSPVDGSNIAQFPRSDAKDIDFALDAAHRAAPAWGKTSVQQRSRLLLQVADRIEQHLEYLAVAESWDNGKPIRETLNADLPLAVDHFATSPAACAPRREAPPRLMKPRWLIISMNRWGWSVRLSRGTSRC